MTLYIVRVFSQHFSPVCFDFIPDSSTTDIFNILSYHSTFSFSKIRPTQVLNAIKQLNLSSGAGLDGIKSRHI